MLGLPAARSAFQRASKSPVRAGRQLHPDAVQALELLGSAARSTRPGAPKNDQTTTPSFLAAATTSSHFGGACATVRSPAAQRKTARASTPSVSTLTRCLTSVSLAMPPLVLPTRSAAGHARIALGGNLQLHDGAAARAARSPGRGADPGGAERHDVLRCGRPGTPRTGSCPASGRRSPSRAHLDVGRAERQHDGRRPPARPGPRSAEPRRRRRRRARAT